MSLYLIVIYFLCMKGSPITDIYYSSTQAQWNEPSNHRCSINVRSLLKPAYRTRCVLCDLGLAQLYPGPAILQRLLFSYIYYS